MITLMSTGTELSIGIPGLLSHCIETLLLKLSFSLMAAFLNLRSTASSPNPNSFSPEELMALQDLPGYGYRLDELKSLPGLDPRHTVHSLGEMMEQLRLLPSRHQTDQQKEILELNPSLKSTLVNMKGAESDHSDTSGSVDGDEVGESRAKSLFLAAVNGAPEHLTKRAMALELKKEKSNAKMVEFIEVFLCQGVSTGQVTVTLSFMKQLSSINKEMFKISVCEALDMLLDQSIDEESIVELLALFLREVKDAKRNLCHLLVEKMTGWVTSAGLSTDLSSQNFKPAATLRILKRPDIRRELEEVAAEGYNILYQSLKVALISPHAGLLSTTRELMLEMIILIKCSINIIPDLRKSEAINDGTPLQDPVRTVPRRLITTSMAYSEVLEDSSEEEKERQEEVRLMLPVHFQVELGGETSSGTESITSPGLNQVYDSDASVVVEFEETIEKNLK